ncbi:OB-fold protein [Aquimarina sp. 2201CG5-10]|uniref:OB-fold protein n=1 Tax=Aquimarina callyspongiae TaxID=3098150 RepID=UPI002AB5322C|nr:hypothetical protein [Aquimarina sp. 2201CG5-10]MDY8138875.1 hypothetical protein [Aquimarina sp. 2201CG5-10]
MKKILMIVLVLLIAAIAVYKYVYQSHRDIKSEEAAFTVNATDLAKEFSEDQEASSKKYLNKTIVVSGEITEVEESAILLNEAAYCTFDDKTEISGASVGTNLTVKGRCIGYDELLEVIKLDQVSIVK